MTRTTITITPELRAAAVALSICADYSIENPTVSLRNNPHYAEARRTHRKATGSVNTLWVCGCSKVMPLITGDLTTVCCGATEVDLHR
jgi:hypothetical protein